MSIKNANMIKEPLLFRMWWAQQEIVQNNSESALHTSKNSTRLFIQIQDWHKNTYMKYNIGRRNIVSLKELKFVSMNGNYQ